MVVAEAGGSEGEEMRGAAVCDVLNQLLALRVAFWNRGGMGSGYYSVSRWGSNGYCEEIKMVRCQVSSTKQAGRDWKRQTLLVSTCINSEIGPCQVKYPS